MLFLTSRVNFHDQPGSDWNWRLFELPLALSTTGMTIMLPTAGAVTLPRPPSENVSPTSLTGAPASVVDIALKLLLPLAAQSGDVGLPLAPIQPVSKKV